MVVSRRSCTIIALLTLLAIALPFVHKEAMVCDDGPVYITDHPEALGKLVFRDRDGVPFYQGPPGTIMIPTA